MFVVPVALVDAMSATSAIWLRCRSSGVATLVAMISGLAPGIEADTEIAGKSVFGNGATGRSEKASMPASAIARVSRVVATGRLMKVADRFMPAPHLRSPGGGTVPRTDR